MKNIFLTTLLVVSVLFSAQAKDFEGTIEFTMSYKNLPEEMAMYEAMLPKKMMLYMKGDKSMVEQTMGGLVSMKTINDQKSNTTTVLLDMMGEKIAVKTEDSTSNASKYTVKKTKETKVIAGYTCKKVTISDSASNVITMWVTKKIPAYKNSNIPSGLDIGGFPMEYNITQNEMKMKVTAKVVTKKKLEKTLFEIPKDYQIKSAEEMGDLLKNFKL